MPVQEVKTARREKVTWFSRFKDKGIGRTLLRDGAPRTLASFFLTTAFSGMALFLTQCSSRTKCLRKTPELTIRSWACNYNEFARPEELTKFDLVVVDADAHPDLSLLKKNHTRVIGYLSLGEVGEYRWYWPDIQNRPWVLHKNQHWDSHMIDVRSPEWQELILETIIPDILKQGFDGLFLDTIDNAEYLEKYHAEKKYPGAEAAMIKLIHAIRQRYPRTTLLANRGFSLLDAISVDVDAVVAESVFTRADLKKGEIYLRPAAEVEPVVEKLQRTARRCGVRILNLEYFSPARQKNIEKLISKARSHGFIPYVSTVSLDSTYTFTLENAGRQP